MNDPVYTFVKGEGWTLAPQMLTMECTLACGTKVRLEHRNPKSGEYYGRVFKWNGRHTAWIAADNKPIMDHWASEWSRDRLRDRNKANAYYVCETDYIYVTLVVIS